MYNSLKIKFLYLCSLLFVLCSTNANAQESRKTLNDCVEKQLANAVGGVGQNTKKLYYIPRIL